MNKKGLMQLKLQLFVIQLVVLLNFISAFFAPLFKPIRKVESVPRRASLDRHLGTEGALLIMEKRLFLFHF
jgi:hypothetical protein